MRIEKLQAYQFRNLKSLEYMAHPRLNIFIGANAQGKTNILESVYTLAHTSSFRTANDRNLVNYHSQLFKLRGEYILEQRAMEALLVYTREQGKEYKINQKKANHNHVDRLRVVLFTPDDLYLVKGNPGRRRAFLDSMLKDLMPEYRLQFENYQKILKKRNLLLKNGNYSNSFSALNDIFIDNAARMILARINLIHSLDDSAVEAWQNMKREGSLKIRYALSFPVNSGKINLDVIKEALTDYLREKKAEESARRTTLAGPHLDDINIYLDDRMAKIFASQGQQRAIVVSLKLAELNTVKKITGYYPVFLIDEVLAELDDEKRQSLVDYLERAPFQSFMSAVSLGELNCSEAAIHQVDHGQLL
ncbi:MAG: DNA replication/repair protein RecF [Deltaproteobacteria bacterium]